KPRPPRDLNKQISPELENIILKTLEKDATRRHQTAQDLRIELERLVSGTPPALAPKPRKIPSPLIWAGLTLLLLALLVGGNFLTRKQSKGTAIKPRRTVAVLGFKNLNGNATDAWISTALSEMLTTELGANGKLRTIPGENVARMKADLSLPDNESLTRE